jgi:hypothetical protein
MPRLYVLFRIDTTVDTIPTCKLIMTAAPDYIFPTSYNQGIYIEKQFVHDNGRTYHILVEIDREDEAMTVQWVVQTVNRGLAGSILVNPVFVPSHILARGRTAVSNTCVGYTDEAKNEYSWVMLVSVEFGDDDEVRSTEVEGGELREETWGRRLVWSVVSE